MTMRLRLLACVLVLAALPASSSPWRGGPWRDPADSVSVFGRPDASPPTVTFDYNPDGATIASGPGNLSDSLTVNGTAMTIVASYDARNAGATWAASGGSGGTLTRTGSSGALADVPFTETAARAYDNASNDYFTGTSTALIDTEDVAIEFLYHFDGAAMTGAMIGQMVGGIAKGWAVTMGSGSSGLFIFASQNGAVQATVNSSTGLGTPGWRHVMMFWDRSETSGTNGVKFYIDGASDGSGGFINHASVAGTDPLLLMRGGFGAVSNFDGKLGFVRAWKCSACMAGGATNPTQWLAVAQERFAKLAGSWASVPGIALTSTRATTNYCSINRDMTSTGRQLFLVGNNWPCINQFREKAGGETVKGFAGMKQHTNSILYSEKFDNAAWTKTNGAITANATTAPDGLTTADAYESTDAAGAVEHCVEQAVTETAVNWSRQVFAAPGAVTWLRITDATAALSGWVNLSTCAMGTNGFTVTPTRLEPEYVGGFCRVSFASLSTAAAHTIRICGATADNTTTYDDGTNSTADFYLWGAEDVALLDATSHDLYSYIQTTSASVTSNANYLLASQSGIYPSAEPYRVATTWWSDTWHTTGGEASPVVIRKDNSNGTANGTMYYSHWIPSYVDTTGGCSVIAGSDLTPGEVNRQSLIAKTNDFRGYLNGAQSGSTDTTCTPNVTSYSAIYMGGADYAGTSRHSYVVGRFTVSQGAGVAP